MGQQLPYDDSDISSIFEFAKTLEGKTFSQVVQRYLDSTGETIREAVAGNKGHLGQIIEKCHFGYAPNSRQEADFYKAGLELKVFGIIQRGEEWRAKERLVLSMISYDHKHPEELEDSELLSKISKILMVLYDYTQGQQRLDFVIQAVYLYLLHDPRFAKDLEIIRQDYRKITKAINEGRAHELSEGMTMYLGAATKGANREKSMKTQFKNPDILARQRAFSFKNSYMTRLVKQIMGEVKASAEAIQNLSELDQGDFEAVVIQRIMRYRGKTQAELAELFGISAKKTGNKSIRYTLTCRMIGVTSHYVEEFLKANVQVKTIYIRPDSKMQEHMSFRIVKLADFAEKKWEDSEIREFFDTTKFLMVVFGGNKENPTLLGAKFWNMSGYDIDGILKSDWRKYQQTIDNGVALQVRQDLDSAGRLRQTVSNSLPKESQTRVMHLRPKARRSVYVIDGVQYGRGNPAVDGDVLPTGDIMVRQAFWLNREYLRDRLCLAEFLEDT